MIEISTTVQQSFENVTNLTEQFDEYNELFTLVSLQYSGNTQIMSIQYRLRTCHSFSNEDKFFENFLNQYLKNPILISSHLYTVQIYDQKTTENLANDPKYFFKKDEFYAFNLTELFNHDSEFITIFINSNFVLYLDSLIESHISKQPRLIEQKTLQYGFTSILKTELFPCILQCFNIPIHFDLNLNQFIEYFIPKKFLIALDKWVQMEKDNKKNRIKNHYAQMIHNRFKITPLEFSHRIQLALNNMIIYIQENFNKVIQIRNKKGVILPEIPNAYHQAEKTGMLFIRFKFRTNFNNQNPGIKSLLIFNFKWMSKIFKKFV
ncbi:MAG: hypothetical protein ACFFD2_15715 [Promethearchaeota archaeon]